MNENENKLSEVVADFLNAVEAAAVNAKRQIAEIKGVAECSRFEAPDSCCPWPGEYIAIDKGCSEFYSLPKAQKKKEKKPPHMKERG